MRLRCGRLVWLLEADGQAVVCKSDAVDVHGEFAVAVGNGRHDVKMPGATKTRLAIESVATPPVNRASFRHRRGSRLPPPKEEAVTIEHECDGGAFRVQPLPRPNRIFVGLRRRWHFRPVAAHTNQILQTNSIPWQTLLSWSMS